MVGSEDPPRALVTGATGLVGSAVTARLLLSGWRVTAVVRDPTRIGWAADALAGAQIVAMPPTDDPAAIDHLLERSNATVVVNCAGVLRADGPAARRDLVDVNLTLVGRLLDAGVRARIARVIHLGSGFEYLPTDRPLRESDVVGPDTLYGAAKAAASELCRYYARHEHLDVVVARPFSLFGPRERSHRFVPYVIGRALANQPVEMSSGSQVRDYLFVDDLADGLVRVATHTGPLPEVMNFCGSEVETLAAFAARIIRLSGSASELLVGSRPPNPADRATFLGDYRLARDELDWQPSTDLDSGLAQTIEWYSRHDARRELVH
jgi:nucleoside-diphosphate-sugar epimerase